jgi:hypothetical protein
MKYMGHDWLFRGQRSHSWELETSLERCCNRQKISPQHRSRIEQELFREFRRTYQQYSQHIPDLDSAIEWLSLMQHHGAPTRLLDFTYSIYVAAYFALEAADGELRNLGCSWPLGITAIARSLGIGRKAKFRTLARTNPRKQ